MEWLYWIVGGIVFLVIVDRLWRRHVIQSAAKAVEYNRRSLGLRDDG